MSKHTPAPWHYSEENSRPSGAQLIYAEDGWLVADACGAFKRHDDERQANAHRIIACVNACAGMEDPAGTISLVRRALQFFLDDGGSDEECRDYLADALRALGDT